MSYRRVFLTTLEHLLFDPQTSGGLLIALPADRADALASALERDGLPSHRASGRVEPGAGIAVEV